jgi:hypothetical protein
VLEVTPDAIAAVLAYSSAPTGLSAFGLILWGLRVDASGRAKLSQGGDRLVPQNQSVTVHADPASFRHSRKNARVVVT